MARVGLSLFAHLDGAGDGWIDLLVEPAAGAPPLVGFHVRRLVACAGPAASSCKEVAVFGGSGGAAEASRLHVTAGHAFNHGVFGACLDRSACVPLALGAARPSAPLLLTTLSVAIPELADGGGGRVATRVCLEGGWMHPAGGGAPLQALMKTAGGSGAGGAAADAGAGCVAVARTPGAGPAPLAPRGVRGNRSSRRGVALVRREGRGGHARRRACAH